MGKRPDWVSLIEAAYVPHDSDEGWLGEVVAAAQPAHRPADVVAGQSNRNGFGGRMARADDDGVVIRAMGAKYCERIVFDSV